ncbi:MAG: hypothetical protein ACRCXZ_05165 [Patescibacteria group bacterium]
MSFSTKKTNDLKALKDSDLGYIILNSSSQKHAKLAYKELHRRKEVDTNLLKSIVCNAMSDYISSNAYLKLRSVDDTISFDFRYIKNPNVSIQILNTQYLGSELTLDFCLKEIRNLGSSIVALSFFEVMLNRFYKDDEFLSSCLVLAKYGWCEGRNEIVAESAFSYLMKRKKNPISNSSLQSLVYDGFTSNIRFKAIRKYVKMEETSIASMVNLFVRYNLNNYFDYPIDPKVNRIIIKKIKELFEQEPSMENAQLILTLLCNKKLRSFDPWMGQLWNMISFFEFKRAEYVMILKASNSSFAKHVWLKFCQLPYIDTQSLWSIAEDCNSSEIRLQASLAFINHEKCSDNSIAVFVQNNLGFVQIIQCGLKVLEERRQKNENYHYINTLKTVLKDSYYLTEKLELDIFQKLIEQNILCLEELFHVLLRLKYDSNAKFGYEIWKQKLLESSNSPSKKELKQIVSQSNNATLRTLVLLDLKSSHELLKSDLLDLIDCCAESHRSELWNLFLKDKDVSFRDILYLSEHSSSAKIRILASQELNCEYSVMVSAFLGD